MIIKADISKDNMVLLDEYNHLIFIEITTGEIIEKIFSIRDHNIHDISLLSTKTG